jgi:hypothetical protein
VERPFGAAILTVFGGLLILAGGAVVALIGGIVAAVLGIFSGLWLIGLVLGGLTILVGLLMLAIPPAHSYFGLFAIVFAVVSLPFALGGFFLGFLLAVIGGALALRWRPLPPSRVITIEARTVP